MYNVATGNNTDTEIFFDGWEDPYQTTGVLSMQLDLEDLQLEDVDIITLSYNLTIYNHFYKYLEWTSTYAPSALVSGCSHQLCRHCCCMGLQGNTAGCKSTYCACRTADPLHYCSLVGCKANKAACRHKLVAWLHMH